MSYVIICLFECGNVDPSNSCSSFVCFYVFILFLCDKLERYKSKHCLQFQQSERTQLRREKMKENPLTKAALKDGLLSNKRQPKFVSVLP